MQVIRFVCAAALVLVASTAAAQGGQGQGMSQEQRQARQNEMLFKGITLSPAQKVKIDSIQAAARTENMAMMQQGGMQDSTTRAKMMDARRKTNADIRAVLTADQQTTFDKNLAEMPAPGAGRRPPNSSSR
ncbi:MAG TPA: hypothetical protein VM764_08810 [Gemmatimonadaceae bacterium]|nr:hypothetical protein [Gemmatimonadaceae bacterium]